eukprot:gnl/TRDRNA2_/TRDRNA2_187820_c0_seq1.p1 gnl/TRDRNA2_/TRDRNA2_187820_c0~~gnl/TRDRNA2_/TRDRNA2_187820_c0_seq1.p1  ORF type:complete len:360 (-),score=76.99 gnl/TRDRNA2_/TRDRNA2_187820_c0_seq1:83-1162(-)
MCSDDAQIFCSRLPHMGQAAGTRHDAGRAAAAAEPPVPVDGDGADGQKAEGQWRKPPATSIALGAAAVAVSLAAAAAAASAGGLGLGLGLGLGAASGLGGTAAGAGSMGSASVAIAGLAAAAAAGSAAVAAGAGRRHPRAKEAAQPLLSSALDVTVEEIPYAASAGEADEALVQEDAAQHFFIGEEPQEELEDVEQPSSKARRTLSPGPEAAPSSGSEAEPLPPKRRSRRVRAVLMSKVRKRAASWVTILIRGVELVVNSDLKEVKLNHPRCDKLLIGEEAVSLVATALQLEGEVLTLAISDDAEGCKRAFKIELENLDMALEMTLALKILRANADTGAGIADWGERPADRLERPLPAE